MLDKNAEKRILQILEQHRQALSEPPTFKHHEVKPLLLECYAVIYRSVEHMDDIAALAEIRELITLFEENMVWDEQEERMFKRGVRGLEMKLFREMHRDNSLLENFSWDFSWDKGR